VAELTEEILRIGFTLDGETLVAASWGFNVSLLHATSLAELGRYAPFTNIEYEAPHSAPLSVRLDGIVWLRAPYADAGFITFDPQTHAFAVLPEDTWPQGFEPTGSLASRDGGRLLVAQRSGPFAVLDVVSGVARLNAAGLTSFDSMDDSGSRVLSGTAVYDGSFALVGQLPGPGILSGDGRRAFTLEHRSDWQLGGPAPRLHVIDVTVPAQDGGPLPVLGTVDLLDHDICAAEERACAPDTTLAVTLDGRVVFVQAYGVVVVVPIPEELVGSSR
jgi:hypothetical protein